MAKIGIVGLGYVGAASAYSIVTQGICSELYLYDIKQDLALAHARDLEDMSAIHFSYTKFSCVKFRKFSFLRYYHFSF